MPRSKWMLGQPRLECGELIHGVEQPIDLPLLHGLAQQLARALAALPSIDRPESLVVDYRALEAHALLSEILRERLHGAERLHLLCVRQGSPDAYVDHGTGLPVDRSEIVEASGEPSNRRNQGLLGRIEPSLDGLVFFGRKGTS